MERLVKRFGYDEMMTVTPEAHQRLLTHLRKQKVYAHNKAVERRAERDARRTMGLADGGEEAEVEAAARRDRHAEYEALLEEEEAADDADGGQGEGGGGGLGAASARPLGGRKGRAAAAAGQHMQATWMDRSSDAAGIDLLSAPLIPIGSDGGRVVVGGKRRRAEAAVEVNPAAERASMRAERASARVAAEAAAEGGVVRFEADTGKLVVSEGGGRPDETMEVEVDPEDEIVRAGGEGQSKKRRRLAEREVATASKAEEAETEALAAAAKAGGRAKVDERNKRQLQKRGGDADSFGANFGDQFAPKKGAQGDVLRDGSSAPYAYLPLNPRLLGKKQQRKAKETMAKLAAPMKKMGVKIGAGAARAKHGLQARRGRKSKH